VQSMQNNLTRSMMRSGEYLFRQAPKVDSSCPDARPAEKKLQRAMLARSQCLAFCVRAFYKLRRYLRQSIKLSREGCQSLVADFNSISQICHLPPECRKSENRNSLSINAKIITRKSSRMPVS
jgi:hypothetical protein